MELPSESALHIGDYLSATRHLSWEEDAAIRARKEMEAQTIARRAVREAGCFFDMAGERDAKEFA